MSINPKDIEIIPPEVYRSPERFRRQMRAIKRLHTNREHELIFQTAKTAVAGLMDVLKVASANPLLSYIAAWLAIDGLEKASYRDWSTRTGFQLPYIDPSTAGNLKTALTGIAAAYAAAPLAAAALPGLLALKGGTREV